MTAYFSFILLRCTLNGLVGRRIRSTLVAQTAGELPRREVVGPAFTFLESDIMDSLVVII